MLGLIPRYREGALPDPITPSALKPFGISPNNAHRLLGALGFLGLIDDAGRPTGYFERLRRASAEEYPAALADPASGDAVFSQARVELDVDVVPEGFRDRAALLGLLDVGRDGGGDAGYGA